MDDYNEGAKMKAMKEAEMASTAASKLPLSTQEKEIALLHDTISELMSRLKPVLTPEPPSAPLNEVADKEVPVQSPLAVQLSANNNGVRKANSKLRGLLERLEC